jgi:hypothetical protein
MLLFGSSVLETRGRRSDFAPQLLSALRLLHLDQHLANGFGRNENQPPSLLPMAACRRGWEWHVDIGDGRRI